MKIICRKPLNGWGIAAASLFFIGASTPLFIASIALDGGTTPEWLTSMLTTSLVIGVLLGGVGQLMRTTAHGSKSTGGKRIDGIGKAIGLFGWSLGLLGAVTFAVIGTDTPEWVMGVGSYGGTALVLLIVVASIFSIERKEKMLCACADGL